MDYANIILEMLDRIKTLEKEVSDLKKQYNLNLQDQTPERASSVTSQQITGKRDTTRYLFEGNVYLKNRLVLAVIKSYIKDNPTITRDKLKQTFDKSLQGSIGVVEFKERAEERADFQVRFFTKPTDTINLIDGSIYVCSQWGILNIPNFIKRAKQLGYRIEPITMQ